jgi:Resolvase, N terminal domain
MDAGCCITMHPRPAELDAPEIPRSAWRPPQKAAGPCSLCCYALTRISRQMRGLATYPCRGDRHRHTRRGMPRTAGSGRKRGTPNRKTVELRMLMGALVGDIDYQCKLRSDFRKWRLYPSTAIRLWEYTIGKPKEQIEMSANVTMNERLAAERVLRLLDLRQLEALAAGLGRNLRHLVLLLDDWQSRGVAFVTLGEGIDTSTAAGRLVAGVLGSIPEFERADSGAHSCRTFSGQGARNTPRSRDRRRPRGVWTPAPGCPTGLRRLGSASQSRASSAGAACRVGWSRILAIRRLTFFSDRASVATWRPFESIRNCGERIVPRHRFDSSPAHHIPPISFGDFRSPRSSAPTYRARNTRLIPF